MHDLVITLLGFCVFVMFYSLIYAKDANQMLRLNIA